ncbi:MULTISPECIES: RHS repeat domain-containing protein [unclassified Pseudomonas]|uniref:RHS repeat domain-containing protein n=1 Tax=unclassified Pseudomonas TaxID=196821 RepID=UPI0021153564|nr:MULTISPECIES: RHS repeat-associated core domain-containing protein [unclassified Pseudomonas]MCU1738143.1 toxin [Pseudomonas sp. 20S_6.2_Bac1]
MSRTGAEHIHTHTPTLAVVDPRGLAVRVVAYCRSVEATEPEERINRSAYDAMGRLTEQWDPRLWALSAEDDETPANLINRYSLSGKVLSSISVDAGRRISLFGDGDQLVQTWDSRGTARRVEYDDLLRPLAIFEQGEGDAARYTERYEYADASADFAAHNQCGQLIRHDDPAGTLTVDDYALTGGVLEQTQRFLSSLELPDWPQGLLERDALLEPVAQAATSATRFNPLGDVLEQTDAKGNRQLFDYTFDGQLLASHLQLSGQATPQTLVSAIAYSAYGQVEQETAGNGVVSTLTYRPESGRLIRLQARHGTEAALQDLRYEYDPVGNVLSIEDAALPIRYFANQRVEPIKHYDYDSLYQLIDATGWEAGTASRGPGFNRFDDPGAVANYHQTYRYDAGGNLLELVHVGPQNHSRKLTAARYSNRCLPEQNDRPPTEDEIAAAFDGNGNLLELQPGQAMSWDLRNQLREVRPVERESSDDDLELYLYGGDGMRRRKVRSTQTNARSLISEVRYLPGLEIRTREGPGEVLQVLCCQAGRSAMQVLHWETTPPSGITNDQYRYNLTDHLGSSSLELDSEAEVISHETYHPYGGTAWFAGRSEVEASYKTVRYSGQERDATGLYYYGFRYYAPWVQRWINPDPAGDIDGLNLYGFVGGNPSTQTDILGLRPPRNADEAFEIATNMVAGTIDLLPLELRFTEIASGTQLASEDDEFKGQSLDAELVGADELIARVAGEQWHEPFAGIAHEVASHFLETRSGTIFNHNGVIIKSLMKGATEAILISHGGFSNHMKKFKEPINIPEGKKLHYYGLHGEDTSSGVARRLLEHSKGVAQGSLPDPIETITHVESTERYRLTFADEGAASLPTQQYDIIYVPPGVSSYTEEVFQAIEVYRPGIAEVHAVHCRPVFNRRHERIYRT